MSLRTNTNYGQTLSVSPGQQLAMSVVASAPMAGCFVGLLVTGLVSLMIASSEPAMTAYRSKPMAVFWVMIAQFGIVMGLAGMAQQKLSAATAAQAFWPTPPDWRNFFRHLPHLYFDLHLSGFLITSGMFGGLALYGTVTKKDLTGVGSFCRDGALGSDFGWHSQYVYSQRVAEHDLSS